MMDTLLVLSLAAAIAGFVAVTLQTTPEQQPVKVKSEEPLRKRQRR